MVEAVDQLPDALTRLGLDEPRRVVVVVGGAGSLTESDAEIVGPLLGAEVAPVCEELGVAVVDGGTDSGVMRLMGQARATGEWTFPLVGVVAAGTVEGPDSTIEEPAPLEPNHSGFVVVPGSSWGDESPWLTRVASTLAAGHAVVGVLIQGGAISVQDVGHLVDAGYPVLALRGTGRLADELTEPAGSDKPAVEALRASPLVQTLEVSGPPGRLAHALRELLGSG